MDYSAFCSALGARALGSPLNFSARYCDSHLQTFFIIVGYLKCFVL